MLHQDPTKALKMWWGVPSRACLDDPDHPSSHVLATSFLAAATFASRNSAQSPDLPASALTPDLVSSPPSSHWPPSPTWEAPGFFPVCRSSPGVAFRWNEWVSRLGGTVTLRQSDTDTATAAVILLLASMLVHPGRWWCEAVVQLSIGPCHPRTFLRLPSYRSPMPASTLIGPRRSCRSLPWPSSVSSEMP